MRKKRDFAAETQAQKVIPEPPAQKRPEPASEIAVSSVVAAEEILVAKPPALPLAEELQEQPQPATLVMPEMLAEETFVQEVPADGILEAMPDIIAEADAKAATLTALREAGILPPDYPVTLERAKLVLTGIQETSAPLDEVLVPRIAHEQAAIDLLPEIFGPEPFTAEAAADPPQELILPLAVPPSESQLAFARSPEALEPMPEPTLAERLVVYVQALEAPLAAEAAPLLQEVMRAAEAVTTLETAGVRVETVEAARVELEAAIVNLLTLFGLSMETAVTRAPYLVPKLTAVEGMQMLAAARLTLTEGTHERKHGALEWLGGIVAFVLDKMAAASRMVGRVALGGSSFRLQPVGQLV